MNGAWPRPRVVDDLNEAVNEIAEAREERPLMTEWSGWLPDGGLLKDQAAPVIAAAGGMHAHAPWRPVHEWTTEAWDANFPYASLGTGH
jgi:hypothetical protein